MSNSNSSARSVKISGTALSSLLFQLQNCDGDSEGFLLGGSFSVEHGTISDSQEQQKKEQKHTTCIQSSVNCGRKYSFYDCYGSLTVEDIRKILKSDLQYVIGWFSYRRGSSRHIMSLRERAIHRSLMQLFSHINNEDFLFLLLTDEAIHNTAISSIEYSFHQLCDDKFQSLHVEVVNLLSTAQSTYHLVPSALVLPSNTNVFTSVVNDSRDQLISQVDGIPQEAKNMRSLFRAVLSRMQSLEDCVAEGNRTVEQLAEEVAVLKQEKLQRKPVTTTTTTTTSSSSSSSTSNKTQQSKVDLDSFINENLIELQSDTNTSPSAPTTSKLSEDDNDSETYASQDIA